MDITDFLPRLRRMIQGPLNAEMADCLMTSAVSFCKQSQSVREVVEAQDVKASDKVSINSTDPDLLPWNTIKIYNDDGILERDIDYEQTSRDVVTFLKDFESIKILACFYPTDKKTIPGTLLTYESTICYGAAAELYMTPGKPWTNGELSAVNERKFTQGYRDAWREIESEQFGGFQNPTIKTNYWC